MPGGKIERSEHLSATAQREILVETGINASFKSHLGFVSEILLEQGEVANHFLLHLCELQCDSMKVTSNDEGDTTGFTLSKLQELQEELIPGDYMMIQRIIQKKEKNYYNCVIEKVGDAHFLRKFE